MLSIFEDLNGSGRTVVMITHEDDVAEHADRLVRLADGRIVRDVSLDLAGATEAVGARRPVESI